MCSVVCTIYSINFLSYVRHQKASEVLLKWLTDHLGERKERERRK